MARITKESRIQELEKANTALNEKLAQKFDELSRLKNKWELVHRLLQGVTREFDAEKSPQG